MSGRRGEIARCMAFSLEHAEAASEVRLIDRQMQKITLLNVVPGHRHHSCFLTRRQHSSPAESSTPSTHLRHSTQLCRFSPLCMEVPPGVSVPSWYRFRSPFEHLSLFPWTYHSGNVQTTDYGGCDRMGRLDRLFARLYRNVEVKTGRGNGI